MRAPYLLFKRSAGGKNGKIYYVKFWNPDTYNYKEVYSVGSLQNQLGSRAAHLSPTSKAGADTIVNMWLQHGKPIRSGELFTDYLIGFWDVKGDYVKISASRGRLLSIAYLSNNRSAIKKHVIPYLEGIKKERMTLTQITPALLEDLLMHLSETTNLSNRRINGIYQAVTVALSEAKRLGKIQINPAESVRKLAEKKPERKILTPDEVRKFFSVPPDDLRLYGINLMPLLPA